MKIRPIAIHLPQFHPIPENDEWWGKGFTEWTNVAKAKPLFNGHYQPHLPADLGFYDLRLEQARFAQAELAKKYGIYGFCYYHYWFNGKRLLEKPVDEILQSGKPDFPFMLCWANENWSRRWDGSEDVLLMKQEYSENDARAHCRHLIPYFKDPRYIRVYGKPFFVIYKPFIIPELDKYISTFREEAKKENMDLYICRIETNVKLSKVSDHRLFDAAIEFQPHSELLYKFMSKRLDEEIHHNFSAKAYLKFHKIMRNHSAVEDFMHRAMFYLDYGDYADFLMQHYEWPEQYKRFPGITPGWDNTARRGKKAMLFKNAVPSKYGEWLHFITQSFKPYSSDENFVFINAWNEWAEGNHLEPCQKWGLQFLEATKAALDEVNQ